MKVAICLSLAGTIWGGLFLAVRLVVGAVEAVPLVWMRYILAFLALYALPQRQKPLSTASPGSSG